MEKDTNDSKTWEVPRVSHELGHAIGKLTVDFQSLIEATELLYSKDKKVANKILDIATNIDKAASLGRELSELAGEKNITTISSFITDCEPFFEKARKRVCKKHKGDLEFIEKVITFIKNNKEKTK